MALKDRNKHHESEPPEQHKELFAMLHELQTVVSSGKSTNVVPLILRRLVTYANDHLDAPEHIHLQADQSVHTAHKNADDKLTREVMKLMEDLESTTRSQTQAQREAAAFYDPVAAWRRTAVSTAPENAGW
jgi:hemerythrin